MSHREQDILWTWVLVPNDIYADIMAILLKHDKYACMNGSYLLTRYIHNLKKRNIACHSMIIFMDIVKYKRDNK